MCKLLKTQSREFDDSGQKQNIGNDGPEKRVFMISPGRISPSHCVYNVTIFFKGVLSMLNPVYTVSMPALYFRLHEVQLRGMRNEP